MIRAAEAADAASLAVLHADSFDQPWGEADIAALLGQPGAFGLIAHDAGEDAGFLLARAVAGEAEILTVAVAPHRRRFGLGRALVDAAEDYARRDGAEAIYLEVAVDNTAALALYEGRGFARAGFRPRYYARVGREAADALVLRLPLAPG